MITSDKTQKTCSIFFRTEQVAIKFYVPFTRCKNCGGIQSKWALELELQRFPIEKLMMPSFDSHPPGPIEP